MMEKFRFRKKEQTGGEKYITDGGQVEGQGQNVPTVGFHGYRDTNNTQQFLASKEEKRPKQHTNWNGVLLDLFGMDSQQTAESTHESTSSGVASDVTSVHPPTLSIFKAGDSAGSAGSAKSTGSDRHSQDSGTKSASTSGSPRPDRPTPVPGQGQKVLRGSRSSPAPPLPAVPMGKDTLQVAVGQYGAPSPMNEYHKMTSISEVNSRSKAKRNSRERRPRLPEPSSAPSGNLPIHKSEPVADLSLSSRHAIDPRATDPSFYNEITHAYNDRRRKEDRPIDSNRDGRYHDPHTLREAHSLHFTHSAVSSTPPQPPSQPPPQPPHHPTPQTHSHYPHDDTYGQPPTHNPRNDYSPTWVDQPQNHIQHQNHKQQQQQQQPHIYHQSLHPQHLQELQYQFQTQSLPQQNYLHSHPNLNTAQKNNSHHALSIYDANYNSNNNASSRSLPRSRELTSPCYYSNDESGSSSCIAAQSSTNSVSQGKDSSYGSIDNSNISTASHTSLDKGWVTYRTTGTVRGQGDKLDKLALTNQMTTSHSAIGARSQADKNALIDALTETAISNSPPTTARQQSGELVTQVQVHSPADPNDLHTDPWLNHAVSSSLTSLDTHVHTSVKTIKGTQICPNSPLIKSKGKRHVTKSCPFDKVTNDVLLKIFSHLHTDHLCTCAQVCRHWYNTVWDHPILWTSLVINNPNIDIDRALKYLTRRLSYNTPKVCMIVEKINVNGCIRLTDRGLQTVVKRCPELRCLDMQQCNQVTTTGVTQAVTRCVNLERLDVTGCPLVTCIRLNDNALAQSVSRHLQRIYLRYLDMTDCTQVSDTDLSTLTAQCPQLLFFYLRRCPLVSDVGLTVIANNCSSLRELSVSDCTNITDLGMRELAKLRDNLRYLSVAKCDQITDLGVVEIARHCSKLRYLNVRGCPAVTDRGIEGLARSCPRLKSLDVGKCPVTDQGLYALAVYCPSLRKLSLKSCHGITDKGLVLVAYRCPQLQQLHVQDCCLSSEAYTLVRKYCKRAIIEHTNPGFL